MGLKTRGVWDDSELDDELESLRRPARTQRTAPSVRVPAAGAEDHAPLVETSISSPRPAEAQPADAGAPATDPGQLDGGVAAPGGGADLADITHAQPSARPERAPSPVAQADNPRHEDVTPQGAAPQVGAPQGAAPDGGSASSVGSGVTASGVALHRAGLPAAGSWRTTLAEAPVPPVRRGQPKRHLMVQLDSDLVEQIRLRFSVGPGQRTQAEVLGEVLEFHFDEVVTVLRQDRGPRRGAAVQQWGARVPIEVFNQLTQTRVEAATGASQRAAVEAALRVALHRLGDPQ